MNNFLRLMIFVSCLGMMAACSGQHQSKQSNINVIRVTNPKFGKWQDLKKSPVTLTRTLTIGNQSHLNLSAIHYLMGPVVDSAGNIYFIDGKRGKMYSFTPDGKLRWVKGKKGKEPGKFYRPLGLVIHGNRIYTANLSGKRIDVFNLHGNFISRSSYSRQKHEYAFFMQRASCLTVCWY